MTDIEWDTYRGTQRGPLAEVAKGYVLDTNANGAVERVEDQVGIVAEMFGQLVAGLHDRGLVSDADISRMMLGHRVVR